MSEKFASLFDWLQFEAGRTADPGELLAALCDRLNQARVGVGFAALEIAALHPLVTGSVFEWWREDPRALEHLRFHGSFGGGTAPGSSPRNVLGGDALARVRLRDAPLAEGAGELADLCTRGLTDYLALTLEFSDGSQHAVAFATDRNNGFDREQLRLLRRVSRLLTAPVEILVTRQTAATLMKTYLGPRTGLRVLAGAIKRGDGVTVRAVLWYSDLRGFTALSEKLPRDEIIALLNAYFERLAAPVKAFRGEILKFMGDGLLAIFPIDDPEAQGRACDQALKAVRAARAGMAAFNGERQANDQPPLEFGVALHVGEVMYGNIGAPDRLDFTVIGPTVNLASRLEALCKSSGCPVLASESFARVCGEPLRHVGTYELPGIDDPVSVYTMTELA
ncbi:MAG: adenylate/guanylate cyclase domain-containing protein [Alphaproteobacteria bacterium]